MFKISRLKRYTPILIIFVSVLSGISFAPTVAKAGPVGDAPYLSLPIAVSYDADCSISPTDPQALKANIQVNFVDLSYDEERFDIYKLEDDGVTWDLVWREETRSKDTFGTPYRANLTETFPYTEVMSKTYHYQLFGNHTHILWGFGMGTWHYTPRVYFDVTVNRDCHPSVSISATKTGDKTVSLSVVGSANTDKIEIERSPTASYWDVFTSVGRVGVFSGDSATPYKFISSAPTVTRNMGSAFPTFTITDIVPSNDSYTYKARAFNEYYEASASGGWRSYSPTVSATVDLSLVSSRKVVHVEAKGLTGGSSGTWKVTANGKEYSNLKDNPFDITSNTPVSISAGAVPGCRVSSYSPGSSQMMSYSGDDEYTFTVNYTCDPVMPIGWLESSGSGASCAIGASGWTFDNDRPSSSNQVDIWVDGKLIARIPANIYRPDINASYGVSGNHGFSWTLPETYKDDKNHTIRVAMLDIDSSGKLTGSYKDAFGSPKIINCASPVVDFNDASFVTKVVPSTMEVGKSYPVSITMKNIGTKTWTVAGKYFLGSADVIWGSSRQSVGTNIAPGAQKTFSWNVTAPATPGSYTFKWRMLQEGVEWFGDETKTTITVNPKPIPPFDYTLSKPADITITKSSSPLGEPGQVTINKNITSGATKPVDISVSGVPSNVSTLISGSCSPTCTSTITFTVMPSAVAGTYPITVTGSPLGHTTSFNLIIKNSTAINVTCVPSSTKPGLNTLVTWTAVITGTEGVPPYTYHWTGTNIPTSPAPNTASFTISYSTIGVKTASVTVTDKNSNTGTCSPEGTLEVVFNPDFKEI